MTQRRTQGTLLVGYTGQTYRFSSEQRSPERDENEEEAYDLIEVSPDLIEE